MIDDIGELKRDTICTKSALFVAFSDALCSYLPLYRGSDKWRLEDKSSLYDCNVLKKRIDDTLEMIKQGNVFTLMFRLRGNEFYNIVSIKLLHPGHLITTSSHSYYALITP
jgi:hypothetical protein